MTPITREHLALAVEWASGAETTNTRLTGCVYDQETFWAEGGSECIAFCCIHGAAHILARGVGTCVRPRPEDYADCSPIVKVLLCVAKPDWAWFKGSYPKLILDAADAPDDLAGALKWLATRVSLNVVPELQIFLSYYFPKAGSGLDEYAKWANWYALYEEFVETDDQLGDRLVALEKSIGNKLGLPCEDAQELRAKLLDMLRSGALVETEEVADWLCALSSEDKYATSDH